MHVCALSYCHKHRNGNKSKDIKLIIETLLLRLHSKAA